jgi:hypothetical protein
MFIINVSAAFVWGPIFITLTAIGPLRHLSSTVVWVAIISYYANCMGNIATAAALYSSMVSHTARAVAENTEESLAEHRKKVAARLDTIQQQQE